MGFIIATLIVLLVIASVVAQDFSVFSWAYWQEGGSGTSRSEAFRNVGIILAGAPALVFGMWRVWAAHRQAEASLSQAEAANEQARAANEQARIAQQGQITDRFSTAVEHLGSTQLPVRLGGIYALWRLIKDSPERDVISAINILCAFVRHPPHEIGQGPEPSASEDGQASAEKAGSTTKIRPDVQTVLNLIGNKKAVYRAFLPDGYHLDLTGANLTGANLTDADLSSANLTGAVLKEAFLKDVFLTGANLTDADLTGTYLTDADLSGTNLVAANLTRAHLKNTNLTGANLWLADLTAADLTDANLTDADLWVADGLTQEQLDSACIIEGGKPPAIPEGLEPPRKVCVPRTR